MSGFDAVYIAGALPSKSRYPVRTKDVKRIILHHSAGPASQTPEEIANFHVNTRGWPGIAYHYLIYQDGTTYQTQPESVASYHVKGYNADSLGICLVGNFTHAMPSEKAEKSFLKLVQHIRKHYGKLPVIPHGDLVATSCPGEARILVAKTL